MVRPHWRYADIRIRMATCQLIFHVIINYESNDINERIKYMPNLISIKINDKKAGKITEL